MAKLCRALGVCNPSEHSDSTSANTPGLPSVRGQRTIASVQPETDQEELPSLPQVESRRAPARRSLDLGIVDSLAPAPSPRSATSKALPAAPALRVGREPRSVYGVEEFIDPWCTRRPCTHEGCEASTGQVQQCTAAANLRLPVLQVAILKGMLAKLATDSFATQRGPGGAQLGQLPFAGSLQPGVPDSCRHRKPLGLGPGLHCDRRV